MKYISTENEISPLSFRQAVLGNLPPDRGLFFPNKIPSLSKSFVDNLPDLSLKEVAQEVLKCYVGDDLSSSTLSRIIDRVFDFPIPIKSLPSGSHCLELFHGPTYAFKDIGARFLAECLAEFNKQETKASTVLVATSGDTGGAVANGFYDVQGVNVVILYPSGKVSALQEQQLTTLGKNISAIEVKGDFDACQSLVKSAFADPQLSSSLRLSSANSINVARWIPQSIFYFVPFQNGMKNPVFSISSGNYGNLTSGVLAKKMGLPIRKFIAASNENDVVPRFLRTKKYQVERTVPTIANAMDVSDPSNFSRLMKLYEENESSLFKEIHPFSLSDSRIKDVIDKTAKEDHYLVCPHTAIAKAALEELDQEAGEKVFLGTAHHSKFLPVMEKAIGKAVEIPDFAKALMSRKKESVKMENDFQAFKSFLLQ